MSRLSKFLRLPSGEKILLVRVWVLLEITRLCLSIFRLAILRKLLTGIGPFVAPGGKEFTVNQLVRTVEIASRYVPKATCLAQALTIQLVFKESGQQAHLHIGVTGSDNGRLEAHAWVESQGRVIIGGSDLRRFNSITSFE